jgi:hypothetical protein
MTQPDQFVGEVGDNSLSSAIKPRRHALHERRDLRDFHIFPPQLIPKIAPGRWREW